MSTFTVVSATSPVTREMFVNSAGDAIRYRSQLSETISLPEIAVDSDGVVKIAGTAIHLGIMPESQWAAIPQTARDLLISKKQGQGGFFNIEGLGSCRYEDIRVDVRISLYLVLVGLFAHIKVMNEVTGTQEPVESLTALFEGWGADHIIDSFEKLGVLTPPLVKRMKALGGFL